MKLTKKQKEDIKDGLVGGLVVGLVVGLFYGLVGGLFFGLVGGLFYGLVVGLVVGLFYGLVGGLVVGLFYGLVFGSTIIFVSQLVGLIKSNPEFSWLALIVSGVVLVVVQVIGWKYVLKEE